MKHLIAATAIAATTFATQASALSCMKPDIASTFNWAAQEDDRYIVLLGTFDFAVPPPARIDNQTPEDITVQATFEGAYLGESAFQSAPLLDVTIVFECMASWCGSLEPGDTQVLVFAEQTDDGYTLRVDPCFRTVFTTPSETDVARVEACMRGEACDPA